MAQWRERVASNHQVPGSNPGVGVVRARSSIGQSGCLRSNRLGVRLLPRSLVQDAADRGTAGEPCSQRLDSCAAVRPRPAFSFFTVDNSSSVRQIIYTYVDNIVYTSSEVTTQCSRTKISRAGIRSPPHSQATNHSGADGASRFPSIFPSDPHLRGCSLTWHMAPGLGPGCCRFKSCHSHS